MDLPNESNTEPEGVFFFPSPDYTQSFNEEYIDNDITTDESSMIVESSNENLNSMFGKQIFHIFFPWSPSITSSNEIPLYFLNKIRTIEDEVIQMVVTPTSEANWSVQMKLSNMRNIEPMEIGILHYGGFQITNILFKKFGNVTTQVPKIDELGFSMEEKYLSSLAWALFLKFHLYLKSVKQREDYDDEEKIVFHVWVNVPNEHGINGAQNIKVTIKLEKILTQSSWTNISSKKWNESQTEKNWKIFLYLFTTHLNDAIRMQIDGFDIENYEGRSIRYRGKFQEITRSVIERSKSERYIEEVMSTDFMAMDFNIVK